MRRLLLAILLALLAVACDDSVEPLPMELRFAGQVAHDASEFFLFDIAETGPIRVEVTALSLAEGELPEGSTLAIALAVGLPDEGECVITASPLLFALGDDSLFHLQAGDYCLFVSGQGALAEDTAADFEVLLSSLEET